MKFRPTAPGGFCDEQEENRVMDKILMDLETQLDVLQVFARKNPSNPEKSGINWWHCT